MTTAREKLLQALFAIFKKPYNQEGEVSLKRLLGSYRVQIRPDENLDEKITARDEFANRLIDAWKNIENLDRKNLLAVFKPFRMQIKQGLRNAKIKFKQNLEKQGQEYVEQFPIKPSTPKKENSFFKKKPAELITPGAQEPIAGGPQKKNSNRGQCPKCRSNGLVLAPTVNQENQYSCVYCGYHEFQHTKNPELDLPLAAEIIKKYIPEQE